MFGVPLWGWKPDLSFRGCLQISVSGRGAFTRGCFFGWIKQDEETFITFSSMVLSPSLETSGQFERRRVFNASRTEYLIVEPFETHPSCCCCSLGRTTDPIHSLHLCFSSSTIHGLHSDWAAALWCCSQRGPVSKDKLQKAICHADG